jgi:hypothetical protein
MMQPGAAPWIAIVELHRTRRPGMQPRDIYKLLYQAVRGPEHLISSPQTFTDRLAEEWATLDPGHEDPLWESLRPDGCLLRVNLRTYKAQGGQLDELASACLETARRVLDTQAELHKAWEEVVMAFRDRSWTGLAVEQIEIFTTWLEGVGYPAVHHSDEYRALYHPAYRLVTRLPVTVRA